jgi:hypothetical protein
MDESGWPEMSNQQRKRTRYVASFLETGDRAQALLVSGFKSLGTHARIVDMLRRKGSLAESSHQREPIKFTPEVMVAAKDYLVDNQDTPLSTADVVAHLEGECYLEPPTDNHRFLAAFASWVAEQGWSLQVGSRGLIFNITEEAAEERLDWVRYYRPMLGEQYKLEDIIIVDETSFEEGPHPKGELGQGTPSCCHTP